MKGLARFRKISLVLILVILASLFGGVAHAQALPIVMPQEQKAAPTVVEESETYGEEFLGDTAGAAEEDRRRTESLETSGHEGQATLDNLLGNDWQPVSREPKYGVLPLVVRSLKVTLTAVILAAPLAILAALFTSSFAPRWTKEILKPAIEVLAGFPSGVIGFFALVTLATMLQNLFGTTYRLNAFVGGVALSLAVLPIIFTVAEDALSAVPRYLTEASLSVVNLDGGAGRVMFRLVGDDGLQVGETRILEVAGYGKLRIDDPASSGRRGGATSRFEARA